MGRPKHTKPDANQSMIVEAFQKGGCSVAVICDLPGLCDLIVGLHGITELIEVKISKKSKLTQNEQRFHDEWNGSPVRIITGVEDVYWLINKMTRAAYESRSTIR